MCYRHCDCRIPQLSYAFYVIKTHKRRGRCALTAFVSNVSFFPHRRCLSLLLIDLFFDDLGQKILPFFGAKDLEDLGLDGVVEGFVG